MRLKRRIFTKPSLTLTSLCCLIYFSSYITRINFGAVIADIITTEHITKSAASFVTTASFISYGVGQLISGYLGDRLSPAKLIFGGLLTTSACNMVLPFCKGVGWMAAVWLINGLAQAMMWPPVVKIMSEHMPYIAFQKACVSLSIASMIGTVTVYLLFPVIILIGGWKPVFWISGLWGIFAAVFWLKKIGGLTAVPFNDNQAVSISIEPIKNKHLGKTYLSAGIVLISFGIVLQGLLRDGVTTWMPSYILETFHLSSSLSILITIALPCFGILIQKISSYLQRHFFDNELQCAGIIFGVSFVSALLFAFLYDKSIIISAILAGILTGSMHGVNLMLICLVPGRFQVLGNVSFISGLLNCFTYVGSAISMYGFAKLSEGRGWQFTILCWAIIALAGTICCFLCVKRWKRFRETIEPAVSKEQTKAIQETKIEKI